MRDRLVASLCTLLAFASAPPALAQPPLGEVPRTVPARAPAAPISTDEAPTAVEDDAKPDNAGSNDADSPEKPPTELEGQSVEPGEGKVRVAGTPGKAEAPGEVHTVQKGDTLWDLSQKYLGSPWYWPKVWSYNPKIANPHWIYPGSQIRFASEGEEVPSRVDVGNDTPGSVAEAGGPLNPEGEDVVPSSVLEGEDNKVHASGKLVYEPKVGIRYLETGFITKEAVESSGMIVGSFTDSRMLSVPDLVYVNVKRRDDIKVGDRYLVFHRERQLKHPITHQPFGYLTRLLGIAKVEGTPATPLVRMRLMESWGAIERGDLLGPYGEQVRSLVNPRPNDRDLSAYVVSGLLEDAVLMGGRTLIVIDKGREDGVRAGNTFVITRQGDPSASLINPAGIHDLNAPLEDIAGCMAMEVKSRATTCIITHSMLEVLPGDRAVMRAESVKVGAATR